MWPIILPAFRLPRWAGRWHRAAPGSPGRVPPHPTPLEHPAWSLQPRQPCSLQSSPFILSPRPTGREGSLPLCSQETLGSSRPRVEPSGLLHMDLGSQLPAAATGVIGSSSWPHAASRLPSHHQNKLPRVGHAADLPFSDVETESRVPQAPLLHLATNPGLTTGLSPALCPRTKEPCCPWDRDELRGDSGWGETHNAGRGSAWPGPHLSPHFRCGTLPGPGCPIHPTSLPPGPGGGPHSPTPPP